jgi:hypothetical protein
VDHLDELSSSLPSIPTGGPLEALQFFHGPTSSFLLSFSPIPSCCLSEDLPLWLEVEGLVEWVKVYAERKALPFPPPDILEPNFEKTILDEGKEDSAVVTEDDNENTSITALTAEGLSGGELMGEAELLLDEGSASEKAGEMYVGMYQTAIEMILDESSTRK